MAFMLFLPKRVTSAMRMWNAIRDACRVRGCSMRIGGVRSQPPVASSGYVEPGRASRFARPGGGRARMRSLILGVLHAVDATPSSDGLPGAGLLQKMLNWL